MTRTISLIIERNLLHPSDSCTRVLRMLTALVSTYCLLLLSIYGFLWKVKRDKRIVLRETFINNCPSFKEGCLPRTWSKDCTQKRKTQRIISDSISTDTQKENIIVHFIFTKKNYVSDKNKKL